MNHAPLILAERRYTPAPQLHTHAFYQVIFPRRGELHLTIEGANGAVGPSEWAVIHPAMAHSFWAAETSRFLIAELPAPTVSSVCAQLDLAELTATIYLPLSDRAAALRDLFASEITADAPTSAFAIDALTSYTAALLAQTLASRTPTPNPPARKIAERARAYLDAHAYHPLRLAEVATAVNASAAHLQRSFHAAFGLSIVAYLHRRRLKAAQQLLRTTDDPIHTIAEAVGFTSQSAFTRLFQREIGITPRRYRAQYWSGSGKKPA